MKLDAEMRFDGHYDVDMIERIPGFDILRRSRRTEREIRQIEHVADYPRNHRKDMPAIHEQRFW